MDYAIWNQLSEAVFADRREPFLENELKIRIRESWDTIDIGSIRAAIKAWKGRLRVSLWLKETASSICGCNAQTTN